MAPPKSKPDKLSGRKKAESPGVSAAPSKKPKLSSPKDEKSKTKSPKKATEASEKKVKMAFPFQEKTPAITLDELLEKIKKDRMEVSTILFNNNIMCTMSYL